MMICIEDGPPQSLSIQCSQLKRIYWIKRDRSVLLSFSWSGWREGAGSG